MAEPTTLLTEVVGMKTTASIPAAAAWALTLLAVAQLAQASFSNQARGRGCGHRNHTVLERPKVHRVVLDVEVVQAERLAEVSRTNERGEVCADVDGGVGVDRENRGTARGWPGLLIRARDSPADSVVVVGDFDGAETELADMLCGERVFAMTFATAKGSCIGHGHAPRSMGTGWRVRQGTRKIGADRGWIAGSPRRGASA